MRTTATARFVKRLHRLGVVAACMAVTTLPLLAQAPPRTQPKAQPKAQDDKFTESTNVLAVEVPVQVLSKDGEPVRGLKAADFAIYDGRKEEPVTGFEVLDLSTMPAATGAPANPAAKAAPVQIAPSARRRFVLLFDLSFTSPASVTKARQSAKTLLAGLHASDLVAVASYSASRGPELVLGFTADHHQAEEALARIGNPEVAADPLHLTLPPDTGPRAGSESGGGQRHGADNGDSSPSGLDINAVVNANADRVALQSEQRDVTSFTRAVAAFAKMLGSIHGRKYVVFLSEGFNDKLLLGTEDDAEIQAMNEASTAGKPWLVDSDARFGNTKLTGLLEKMLEELRRADCVVESVDPGGLRAFGGENGVKPATGQNTLFAIANGTGGELYRNFNDLSVAMNEMLKRTSITYVLTYQPEGVKHDGEYHKLRVELKNAPRGTRVVYRPGYYAPKPFKDQSVTERMLDAANRVVNGEEGGALQASVLAAAFQGPGGGPDAKAYVPVLIEVDGKSLLAGMQGKALPLEIYAYAMDGKGTVQDFFARTLGLDLGKVEPVLQKSGLKFYGDLSLAPGSYTLRILVRNGTTGALVAKVLPLEVPVFTQAATVLLPPFFPEAPGRWLLVRKNAEAPKDIPYPFQMQSQPFIPAALPVLRPGEETAVALMGYHLQPGVLKADSRVFSQAGEEIGTGEVHLGSRQAGATIEPDRVSATFRPPALKPGAYMLLITLTDAAGKAETSTTSFVVGKGASG